MKKIAVTPGEPAGIGPDLVIRTADESSDNQLVVFADRQMLAERAEQLNVTLDIIDFEECPDYRCTTNQLLVKHIPTAVPVITGQLEPDNGAYVVETLRQACDMNINGDFDAVVTGPVNKGVINKGGISFSGHTEFFAQQANTPDVVMMLSTTGLRVCLATTHIPLAYVSKAITAERIKRVVHIIHTDMKLKFGITQPRIYVCGLNPHAGEGGHLGNEEVTTIIPALDELRVDGIDVIGPLPADTIFQQKYLDDADTILAMYHDQGLPVLKYKGFGNAVNITLGLPFIRTSVDHGTACDLAGTGNIDCGSFRRAIRKALQLIGNIEP